MDRTFIFSTKFEKKVYNYITLKTLLGIIQKVIKKHLLAYLCNR